MLRRAMLKEWLMADVVRRRGEKRNKEEERREQLKYPRAAGKFCRREAAGRE
jgi:hypothetical protein